ncbi:MAG: acyl-CoA synthetase [Ktedonobacteraceae bacterium]|nr:acyl-CoA synthetase [Ktedonobacteraceae bacterium]
MRSIVEAVFQHAQRRPQQPVVFFADQSWSYGKLCAEIERFARALRVWGLRAGERVALFLENCPIFVVTYLGTHLAGGIVVLVNTQYQQVELSHIMTDAEVRLCVTSSAGAQALLRLQLPDLAALVVVDGAGDPSPTGSSESMAFADFMMRGESTELAMPEAEAPAVIGYTSGTTGRSKGALLTHRNVVANVEAVTTAWRWTENDHLLLALPLFHAHGLMVGMHGTLFRGARVTLRPRFEAADILARLDADASITLFFGVPTMYARLLAEAEKQGVPVHLPRLFVCGSAPLSPQLFADFERLFGRTILERYGMTETIMNLTNPYDGERRAGTVGGPFPGQEARIVDVRTRRLLPAGEIGEIEVRGPHVFCGYWKRPEASAEAFEPDGWFKTGDLGRCSADGYYTITGRAHELIISGGYNVYPREVEDVLGSHPDSAEVAVIGLPDSDFGEQVVAVIVPREGRTPNEAEIIAFCRERLASYKKPRRIIFARTLPRNALGKVQKHLLVEQVQ